MITDLERSILYFCPDCSTVSIKKINAFSLCGGKPYTVHCSNESCDEVLAEITPKKGNYRILIECPVCGDRHYFTISQKTMWSKHFFILNCPSSGFGILFAGIDPERLKAEYAAQNELIAGILADNDEDFKSLDVLFDLVEIINSFAQDNAIKCKCGSDLINISIGKAEIQLSCRKCGISNTLPATVELIEELENSDTIVLD